MPRHTHGKLATAILDMENPPSPITDGLTRRMEEKRPHEEDIARRRIAHHLGG
jgi:hypothetical protein